MNKHKHIPSNDHQWSSTKCICVCGFETCDMGVFAIHVGLRDKVSNPPKSETVESPNSAESKPEAGAQPCGEHNKQSDIIICPTCRRITKFWDLFNNFCPDCKCYVSK